MKKYISFLFFSVLFFSNAQRCKFGKDEVLPAYDESMKTDDFIAVNTASYPESSYKIEKLLKKVLIGNDSICVGKISNVRVFPNISTDSQTRSWGYFNKASTAFPFDEGIVLSTGYAKYIGNFYIYKSLCQQLRTGGDKDLAKALDIQNKFFDDSTYIEFDFIPLSNRLSFTYMFASEEYVGDFSCEYKDGFALLIKKEGDANYVNMALIPNDRGTVQVYNIHKENERCMANNTQYYVGDNDPETETNFRGRTIPLTATAAVIPGKTYRIKMVLADYDDQVFDSGVFLKAGSFKVGVSINDGGGNLLPPVVNICSGNSQILNAEVLTAGVTYQWYFNGVAISGATSGTYTASRTGTYKVIISIPGSVCLQQAEITLNVVPPPIITVSADKMTSCYGQPVILTATGADLYDYSGLQGTEAVQTVYPKVKTTYTVTGTYLNGCQGNTTTITIDVDERIVSTLKDVQYCEGSSGTLDAGTGINYTYLWNTGETTQTIDVTKSGTYSVVIKNGGCSKSFSAVASYTPIPVIEEILYRNTTLTIITRKPQLDNLEYTIDGGKSWSAANAFTGVLPNTNYSVAVRVQGSSCFAPAVDFYTFYISNIVTPNFDGINETVDFTAFSTYKDFSALIFDRYGKEVFRATPSKAIWNGKNLKTSLPTTSYYYVTSWVDPVTEKPVQKTGWVVLKNRD